RYTARGATANRRDLQERPPPRRRRSRCIRSPAESRPSARRGARGGRRALVPTLPRSSSSRRRLGGAEAERRVQRRLGDGVVVGEAEQLLHELAGAGEEQDGRILEDAVGLRERRDLAPVEDVDAD